MVYILLYFCDYFLCFVGDLDMKVSPDTKRGSKKMKIPRFGSLGRGDKKMKGKVSAKRRSSTSSHSTSDDDSVKKEAEKRPWWKPKRRHGECKDHVLEFVACLEIYKKEI